MALKNRSTTNELPTDFINKLKSRDVGLLTKIFSETNPILLKMLSANRIFGETAEDLVHQTWERFFTNLEKFEGRSELSTFICGILINKIREHRRSLGKIVFDEDSEAVMERTFSHDGWWNHTPQDALTVIHNLQVSNRIEECLDGLSELQKAAFVLREVEDEESEHICNVLNVSLSNLRVLIFRAKDKLRQCLEGSLEVGNVPE